MFGSLLLILALGYKNIEEQRKLVSPEPKYASLFESIQNHLDEEKESVRDFILNPSIKNLNKQNNKFDDHTVQNLERYIQAEDRISKYYVQNPSLKNLLAEGKTMEFIN